MFILEILSRTPIWVWVLLVFLISRGVVAMRPRVVSPARALIVPVVFFVWGLASLIGAGDAIALKLGLFVVGLLVGLAAGWPLAAALLAAVGGLFAGLFWGRTLGQFAAALRADGEPTTLASLVAMASARKSAKTAS